MARGWKFSSVGIPFLRQCLVRAVFPPRGYRFYCTWAHEQRCVPLLIHCDMKIAAQIFVHKMLDVFQIMHWDVLSCILAKTPGICVFLQYWWRKKNIFFLFLGCTVVFLSASQHILPLYMTFIPTHSNMKCFLLFPTTKPNLNNKIN